MTQPREIDLICQECGHKWRQGHRKRRQCPECASMDIGLLEVALLTPEHEGDGAEEAPPAKTTKKKAEDKGPKGAPLVQSIPKTTTSVDVKNRSSQEEQFSSLLNDVGVRQSDLLASIIMRSDRAEDPKHIDESLRKYRIPLFQRQIVLDAWCSSQGLLTFEAEGPADKAELEDLGGVMKPVTSLMMQRLQMKMLKDMLRDDEPRGRYEAPPRAPESMVPLFNDDGVPVMDTMGNQAMVPASVWLIQQQAKSRHETEAQPHPMEIALDLANSMFDKWITMMNPQGNQAAAAQVAMLQAQNQNIQAMKPLEEKMSALQAEIMKRQALEQQKQQYGQYIADKEKQLEELKRANDKLSDQRLRSYEDTQINMQQKMNELMMKTGEGFTAEFRESRRDVKDLLKEQLKQQQNVDATRSRVQQFTPVQELTVEQMEREVGAGSGVPMLASGVEVLDPTLLEAPVMPRQARRDDVAGQG